MRVAVFGATGALGSAVVDALNRRDHEAVALSHGACDITSAPSVFTVLDNAERVDLVINCAGRIPIRSHGAADMISANAAGPHVLRETCALLEIPLIHISTDCVFDSMLPHPHRYTADSTTNAIDLYGRSKALGEIGIRTVVRTSFVMPDHGLWAWLLEQEEAGIESVEGWRSARWSGSTVWQVADSLVSLAEQGEDGREPIEHVATRDPISKYDVLMTLRDRLDLKIRIEPVDAPRINRGLAPTCSLIPFEAALDTYLNS